MLHFILAEPMTQTMEIHDGKLLEIIRHDDGTGHVLFHAFIYRSEGTDFKDAYEAGWQNIRLTFEGMQIDGELVPPEEYAHSGDLWINGNNENGIIWLPANHTGEICLELVLSPVFDTLKIRATKVTSSLEGPWVLEAYWDSAGNTTRPVE